MFILVGSVCTNHSGLKWSGWCASFRFMLIGTRKYNLKRIEIQLAIPIA